MISIVPHPSSLSERISSEKNICNTNSIHPPLPDPVPIMGTKETLAKITVGVLTTTLCVVLLRYNMSVDPTVIVSRLVRPPLLRNDSKELKQLAIDLQTRLEQIQRPDNCSQSTAFACGHSDNCGFGCQIHHRMGCAIESLHQGIPWIHLSRYKWPYSNAWEEFLEPVGTECNESAVKKLVKIKPYKYFKGGIPIPKDIAVKIQELSPNPFLWTVSQFAKFVFKVSEAEMLRIRNLTKEIGLLDGPKMGIHVRRTDKLVYETKIRIRNEKFYRLIEKHYEDISSGGAEKKLYVFIASEDRSVLPDFQRRFQFSPINVVGFPSSKTYSTGRMRRTQLFQIIRDVVVLTECDYVVCTMSSNVCRLVFELKYAAGASEEAVRPLEEGYNFRLLTLGRVKPKIVPVV